MSLRQHYQKKYTSLPHSVWTNPLHFIACGFGIGAFPYFPGSVATAASIPIILLLSTLPSFMYISICFLLLILGIYLCALTNRSFGTQDHPAIVFDEIATFPLAMFASPMTWPYLLMGFLIFRFLDISKPWPISWVDKHIHGGIGVMLDDTIAALITLAILRIIGYFLG